MSEGTTTYEIRRLYFNRPGEYDVISTGLTLEQAQAHCNDPATSASDGPDGPWFDSYTAEEQPTQLAGPFLVHYKVNVYVTYAAGEVASVVFDHTGPLDLVTVLDDDGVELHAQEAAAVLDAVADCDWPAWEVGY